MIECEHCGAKVWLSDYTEHLFIDHQGECLKCDGWGKIEDKHDPDAEHECTACKGTGRVA